MTGELTPARASLLHFSPARSLSRATEVGWPQETPAYNKPMKAHLTEHGLDGVEIFAGIELAERARLAAELETVSLKRGDVLVRQGEMADALYVVVTGRFAVTLD